jgi:hypothetical protein
MLNLLEWREEGALIHFSWGDDSSFDDTVWEHTTRSEPTCACYNETLLPLALARGQALTAEEVVRAVMERAASVMVPPTGIDWLGLALYAVRRHRQALAQLLVRPPAECQAECLATEALGEALTQVHERVARAVHAGLTSAA